MPIAWQSQEQTPLPFFSLIVMRSDEVMKILMGLMLMRIKMLMVLMDVLLR